MAYIGYFLIGMGSTVLGSIVGMGGGLIIKPLLGFINLNNLETITLLSSASVLAMGVVATTKNTINKNSPFTMVGLYIIIGSTIGGFLGSTIFNELLKNSNDGIYVAKTQAILLIFGLIIVIIANQKKLNYKLRPRPQLVIFASTIMGIIASFLGISGGPFNVAILILGFGIPIKKAAALSTLSGFFSQLVAMIVLLNNVPVNLLDSTMLIVMIPGGIIGGLIGPNFSKKVKDEKIEMIYKATMIGIIFLNIMIIIN